MTNAVPKSISLVVFLGIILSFVAGLGFVFVLAPYGMWSIAILSPLVLYVFLRQSTPKHAFLTGWAYGFGTWLTGAFWLYHSIHDYGGIPAWLAFLMIAVMALVMGLFHAVMSFLFVRFLGKQPLAFASLWVIQEWAKTWVLTGFPWLFVGYAYTDLPFITTLAPIVGVLGISFLSVLVSASLVEIFYKKHIYAYISIGTLLVTGVLHLIAPTWTQPTGKSLSVSLIQANIAQTIKWDFDHQNHILETYINLSNSEWGQDLLIWPEGAVPTFQDNLAWLFDELDKVAKETGTVFITGLPYKAMEEYDPQKSEYPPFYNAVWAMGQGSGLYKKQHLVPFGEYTPFEGMLNILPNLANNQEVLSHSRGGREQAPLMVKDTPMSVAICYEVAYPETTRQNAKDSQFMLTVSNDAWFGTSSGPHQHLQMVKMRAMETGRWFVRGTNNGITTIINHKGEQVITAPQFEQFILRGKVEMMTGTTPFVRFGQTPILLLVSVLIVLSFLAKRR